jgi:hypothetical protein
MGKRIKLQPGGCDRTQANSHHFQSNCCARIALFSFKDEQTENKTKKHGDHERKRQKKAMWDNDLLFRKRI